MMFFEDIKPGSHLRGLDPSGIAEVVQVSRFGPDVLNLVFRANGRVCERLVYRGDETAFEFVEPGRDFDFAADGGLLRLTFEAYRRSVSPSSSTPKSRSTYRRSKRSHIRPRCVRRDGVRARPLRFLLADRNHHGGFVPRNC